MNKDLFLQYIETDCDCKQDHLDIAVNRGLQRAKNDRFAARKMIILAAACVFTFIMCFTVNLEPFENLVSEYYRNWHQNMPGCAEKLDSSIIDMASNIKRNLGGEKCF